MGWNRRKPGDSWCFLVVPPRLAGELDKKDLYEVLGRDSYEVLGRWTDLREATTGAFIKDRAAVLLGLEGKSPWMTAIDLGYPVLLPTASGSLLVPPDTGPSESHGAFPEAITEVFGIIFGGGGLDAPERRCVDCGPRTPGFPKYSNFPSRLGLKGRPLPL